MAPAFSKFGNKTIVTFATGSALYPEDIDRSQQTIYGIFDEIDKSQPEPIKDSDLLEQTLSQEKRGTITSLKGLGSRTLREATNNQIKKEHKGWKVNLSVGDGYESPTTSINVTDGTVILSTGWMRPDAFVKTQFGTAQPKCFKDITRRSGSLTMLNVLNGGQPHKKIPHLNAIDEDGKPQIIAGFLTNDLASPVLTYSRHTYFLNNEGQFTLYNNFSDKPNGGFLGNQIFTQRAMPWCRKGDPGCGKAPTRRCDPKNPHSILFTEGNNTISADLECVSSHDNTVRLLSWRTIY